MRLFAWIAAVTLAAPLALAQPCAKPADRTAFDVAGLKSQLMVIALTCDAREQYNHFVLRFRSELRRHEQTLQSYFARGFGRNGEQQHDEYITSLANEQSRIGLQDGTLFCGRNMIMMDEVLALPQSASLAGYAATKGLAQPIDLTDCIVPGQGAQVAHK